MVYFVLFFILLKNVIHVVSLTSSDYSFGIFKLFLTIHVFFVFLMQFKFILWSDPKFETRWELMRVCLFRFVLFIFVLCPVYPMMSVSLECHSWLPLRVSLTFLSCLIYDSCGCLCIVLSNTYYVVVLWLDCLRLVSCICWCATHIVLCVCRRVVSCVWWYLTHIVLCICLFVFVLYLVYGGI